MSLPSVACFRQMDIIDQLTALYEAILQLSSGSFSPDQILGLQAWYKDEGIVHTGADLTAWTDSSGNGNDLEVVSNPPQFEGANLNSHDTVGFVASDENIGTPMILNSSLGGTAKTIFLVSNKTDLNPDAGWYTTNSNADSNNHALSNGDVRDGFCSDARKNCGSQVVTINGNWRIMSIRSQDASYSIKLDGQDQFTTGTNTFAAGTLFILGAGGFDGVDPQLVLNGSIAEVIIYNAFLSDNQELAVLNYLRNRFDL